MLRTISLFGCLLLLTSSVIVQTSLAQRRYNPINGHLYEKFDTPMTWNDAKVYCESLGGYLATVTSQEENNFIWDNFSPGDYYFGASDAEEEGVWKWLTGEPWAYTNWHHSQPSDTIGEENVINWWDAGGWWNDLNGAKLRGFVCEYEPSGEIFVSEDGSDEDGDGSAEHPYRTIQHGIDMARYGNVIHVAPGTYEENIILHSDIVVLGSGADQTTITANTGNVVTANVLNVTLAGFTIDGQGTADNGISCGDGTYAMMINDNIITGATKGIRCSDSANVSIWSNTIRQNIEDGVYCDGSADVDIKNNTIEQNGRDGILCDGSAHVTIENNIIRQNVEDGIECSGSTKVTINDNNVEGNNRHGICPNGTSEIIASHNIIRYNQSTGVSCGSDSTAQISYNCIMSNDGRGIECVHNANAVISNNLIDSNGKAGIECRENGSPIIRRNTISYNNWHGVLLLHSANPIIGGNLVDANYVVDNEGGVKNHTDNTINATYNYWGTTNEDEIAAMMINEGEGSIIFKPYINTLDEIIADASGDGTISAYDAALILQYIVGLIDEFPATSPIGQAAQKYVAGEITVEELDKILQQWGYPSVFKMLGYENQLLQNYPNPFNPETWIPFKLAQDTPVTISIYDTKGQLIRTIALGNQNAGIYTTKDRAAYWDGRDNLGQKVSSGVYYYTLQAGEFRATQKMVIVK